jgi:hypothetical protein
LLLASSPKYHPALLDRTSLDRARGKDSSMPTTLGELARLVGGDLRGNAAIQLTGAATIDVAGPGHITLADHADRGRSLLASLASAVIAAPEVDCGGKP